MFSSATSGKITVTCPGYVSMTITAMDNRPLAQSHKILITACGRCENTGMIFSADRTTVGRNWGHAPVCIEPVDATVQLPGAEGSWVCTALNPDGTGRQQVAVAGSKVTLTGKYKTMWYVLQR